MSLLLYATLSMLGPTRLDQSPHGIKHNYALFWGLPVRLFFYTTHLTHMAWQQQHGTQPVIIFVNNGLESLKAGFLPATSPILKKKRREELSTWQLDSVFPRFLEACHAHTLTSSGRQPSSPPYRPFQHASSPDDTTGKHSDIE